MPKIPLQQLSATLAAMPMDGGGDQAPARRAQMTWYTGATVMRFDYEKGIHQLTLSMDPGACDLSRLASGNAPLLNGHSDWSVGAVLGVIESAGLAGGKGTATCRFSNRAEVDPIWQDVQDGILRNVSVGAALNKLKETTQDGDKIRSFVATSWTPREVSVVPIGADPNASFTASASTEECECEIEFGAVVAPIPEEEVSPVSETQQKTGQAAAGPDENAIRLSAIKAERQRVSTINQRVSAAGLPVNFAEEHINAGNDLEKVSAAIFAELAKRNEQTPIRSHVAFNHDETVNLHVALQNAIEFRADPSGVKLEAGKDYRGDSLLDMAKACLSAKGVNPRGRNKLETVELALSTSDFPLILAAVTNKSLRGAYEAIPQTFRPWSKQASAPDFKIKYVNQLGDAPSLTLVNEGGEFKSGSLPEARETYNLSTYGKIVPITRQTIINDDLSAMTRVPMLMGRACARLESDTVYNALIANAAMGDSVALFHATHGNLTGSGTALSVASLQVGRGLMRVQRGLLNADGSQEYLNIAPKYLLVPANLETAAYNYTVAQAIVYTKGSDTNPFAGNLTPIIEPRLDANSTVSWYLVGDPNAIDTLEYCYLEGQQGPYMEQRVGFTVDGIEIKVRLDFAVKFIDWRGLYKNVGA